MGEDSTEVDEGSRVNQVTDQNTQGAQLGANLNGHADSSKIKIDGQSAGKQRSDQ